AGVRRPGEQQQAHRSMVVPPRDDSAYAAAAEPRKVREMRACPRVLRLVLRLAGAPRLLGSLGGEIGDLVRVHVQDDLATPGVGVADRESRRLFLLNFLTGKIADKNRLSSHEIPPGRAGSVAEW